MHPLLEDAWIREQVEAALVPYRGRLSATEIEWMRDQLAETLASDERSAEMLRRAEPVEVDQSGEVRRDRRAIARGLRARNKAG